jgi:putative flippase GtrA
MPFLSRQFVAFLLTGGTAAAINFTSRILYSQWLDFSAAIVLAYLTGMVSAFVLARLFVFSSTTQPLRTSAVYFTLVNLAAVAQTWIISLLLADYLLPRLGVESFVQEIAHAVGVMVPVFSSYLGHRRWSFR